MRKKGSTFSKMIYRVERYFTEHDRVTKGAVHKIVHQDYDSTILLWRKRSCVDNGWHPWSNRDLETSLPSAPCWRFPLLRANFRRIDFVIRKKIVIFQSVYKDTYNLIKKGMRSWKMQSSIRDRSRVKRIDCKWYLTKNVGL